MLKINTYTTNTDNNYKKLINLKIGRTNIRTKNKTIGTILRQLQTTYILLKRHSNYSIPCHYIMDFYI
jgi:hypothetical protein